MFLLVRTPRKTVGWNSHYQCVSGIRLGLQWTLRTLLVLKPSVVRFAEVSFGNYLVNGGYTAGFGIRFRFFSVMYSWGCG